ncbi:hypothetical protein N7508_006781 [Penicillium antarcticum]|uniref:uncharacterized protein n=1 Tax=Penicillium antarcticum TaxID=416450 RepID=UPI002391C15C|nr:uncharacterized protein N7508_006781 [Penicillium antarcticum]KAJ5301918.1 hypothetical protein N7508_006781 [Penicillium antarcticum]
MLSTACNYTDEKEERDTKTCVALLAPAPGVSLLSSASLLSSLRVPYNDPSTLYYFLCDPNGEQSLEEPKTSIASVLCLCLMAFHSPVRDQEWRNTAQSRLPLWTTSFDHALSQIPKEVLQQIAPHSDSTNSEYNFQQRVAECPRGLKPAVRPRMSDTGRSRQNRQAPTRIKRLDANGASARSHLPLPPN